ncbi:MAG: hypothetical protein ACK5M3_18505 [Dysgonomonas sp.]
MNWLIIIIVVAVIGAIIGFVKSGGNTEEAMTAGCLSGTGCGYIILQIALALLGLFILFAIGSWLFG